MARLVVGAHLAWDHFFYTAEEGDAVLDVDFTIDDMNDWGWTLRAPGYGEKSNYGRGAIMTRFCDVRISAAEASAQSKQFRDFWDSGLLHRREDVEHAEKRLRETCEKRQKAEETICRMTDASVEDLRDV